MDQQQSWQRALDMARRTLATLEEQAAAYTSLTIRPEMVIELADKRREIERLESLLSGEADGTQARLCNLPRRIHFFGRQNEIARALEALDPEDRGWGLMIDGIGGIGKTALAVEVAHRCYEAARFDTILFTTAKRTRLTPSAEQPVEDRAASLEAMLDEFARALGESGAAQLAGAEKRRALLDALRRHSGPQGRRLLLLDNLETLPAADLAPLFEFLRRLPPDCKAIVTSRRRAGEGAVWLRLEKLDWPAARDLIAEAAGRADRLARILEPVRDRWQELYDAAGGSPLALHWILGLMRGRYLSLDRALALLRRGAEAADGGAPLHEFIYREARRDMAADDWRVLGALSLFAAPAAFEALAAVSDLSRLALESALERLDAYALVDAAGPDGPYSLHPLTRQLAAAELAARPETAGPLRQRYADYWLNYAQRYGGWDKDAYQTYDRLEAEWANLEAAAGLLWAEISKGMKMEEGAPPGATGRPRSHGGALTPRQDEGAKTAARQLNTLARALDNFLWFRGRWAEAVRLSEWAYRAAAAVEDWQKAGRRAYQAAWIHFQRAETDLAAAWAERCAKAWQRDGGGRDQATAARLRGLVAEQRGDLDGAEGLITEALAAYRDQGSDEWVAIVLNDLGEIVRQRADYDRAEDYYRQALALDEKRGHKVGQAIRCGNLGGLELDRERPAQARPWLERALPLAREVGLEDIVAGCQTLLARVLEAEGRPAQALSRAEEALEIHERLRHKDLAETRELVARLRAANLPESLGGLCPAEALGEV